MEREARTWRQRLLVGSVFALPVAVVSMAGMLPGLEDWGRGPAVVGGLPLSWCLQAVLAAVVQVRQNGDHKCFCFTVGFIAADADCGTSGICLQ